MITTSGLTKVYGSFTAVDHLNLTIGAGEMYGFLGPNGAGKTTTLMMILGIVKPTAGEVKIFGKNMSEDPFGIRRRIGVVAETQNFYDDMTAWEYLLFFARLYEVEKPEPRAQLLLERLNLWQWRDVLLGGFSTGMRRKLGFVRALLPSPQILILDEPVSGLDPFGIVQIRELLNEEKARGTTILISSHILSEIERTADRVGILARGRLIIEDCMERIRLTASSTHRVELEVVDMPEGLLEQLRKLPFVTEVSLSDQNVIGIDTLGDKEYRTELGRSLAGWGVAVQGLRTVEVSLEEAFITLTESYINNNFAVSSGKETT